MTEPWLASIAEEADAQQFTELCRWVVYCNCLVMLTQKAFQSAGYFPIIKDARSQEVPPPQRSAAI